MLHADVQWREQYVSHALNRKFTGIIPTGIYQGFECFTDGYRVTIGEVGVENTAVIESHGYSITVRMTEPEVIELTEKAPYAVIEARYQPNVATRVKLAAVAEPEPHHVVLCHVTDNGSSWDIDAQPRTLARTVRMDTTIAQMAAAQIDQMHRYLLLRDENANLSAEAEEKASELARTLASEIHGLYSARYNAQQQLNAEQAEANELHTIALAQSAAASIDTMTRQVGLLDRLLAVEKAARV